MLPLSWKDSLPEILSQHRAHNLGQPRICVIGIGNDLRGDDSAGLIVARTLQAEKRYQNDLNFLILDGGPAPENLTGKLRAFQPDIVLFIDAAHFDETPGTIQWIPIDSIDGMSASSHSLPLSMLARYIASEFECEVHVLGIQPTQNEIGAELSPPVRAAMDEICWRISSFSFKLENDLTHAV